MESRRLDIFLFKTISGPAVILGLVNNVPE